jgi:hypothetical protein
MQVTHEPVTVAVEFDLLDRHVQSLPSRRGISSAQEEN